MPKCDFNKVAQQFWRDNTYLSFLYIEKKNMKIFFYKHQKINFKM